MTYKIGTVGEFMNWTKRVVANPDAAADAPKNWFDDEATASRATEAKISPEAMVKLLSEENLQLLRQIIVEKPASLHELAEISHRKESNLSRTLRKLREAGIVTFEKGPGRTLTPRVKARKVTLELDLIGSEGSVAIEPQAN